MRLASKLVNNIILIKYKKKTYNNNNMIKIFYKTHGLPF